MIAKHCVGKSCCTVDVKVGIDVHHCTTPSKHEVGMKASSGWIDPTTLDTRPGADRLHVVSCPDVGQSATHCNHSECLCPDMAELLPCLRSQVGVVSTDLIGL